MNKAMMMMTALSTLMASAASITGVTARQRWPWNSLVDVDFTINGVVGEAYYIDLSAKYDNGNRSLVAKTFVTEPIAAAGRKTRLVWNLGADYPEFRADDLQITVTATPFSDATPLYMVVDLSNGADAVQYPVRYTTTAPVRTAGTADPCKTTELWLKRVKAGTIQMGGGTDGYAVHTCTLTNDFYLGVFPLTWGQYVNIGQSAGSLEPQFFTNGAFRATRPLDRLRFDVVRDAKYNCPNDTEIYSDSILRRLRDRTGLDFDLPTEWQWEYAARAGNTGNTTGLSGQCRATSEPSSDYEYYSEKGMWSADYGTFYVDAYAPNAWGFYSMVGNVRQWCINRAMTIAAGDELTEPLGIAADGNARGRACKGADWSRGSTYKTYGWRTATDSWNVVQTYNFIGARVCLTIRKSAE